MRGRTRITSVEYEISRSRSHRSDRIHTHTQGNQEVNQRGESREAGKGSISQASPVQFFLELAREMERDGDGEDPLVDFLTRLVRVILLGPGWRIL